MNKRVLVICAGGGHLREAVESIRGAVDKFHLATFKTSATDGIDGLQSLTYIIDPHLSKFKYLINLVQSIFLLIKVRPNIVITTGAGIAIPTCLIAKKFGAKLIMVDTVAATNDLSKTGRFLYKYCDLFIVQWQTHCAKYPKAVYGGSIL